MRIAHRLSISTVAFLIGLGASPVLAQTANDNTSVSSTTAVATPNVVTPNTTSDTLNSRAVDRMVDRDLSQQQQIEQGLKDGKLTTAEGAQLERGESRIDNLESKDLSGTSLSPQQIAQLRHLQQQENERIMQLENNGTTTPVVNGSATANGQMSADVQRDINQQQRIDNGIDNGSLTAAEVAQLEGGQALVDRAESKAGRNDTISASEQQTIRDDLNTQSTDIYNDRHNSTVSSNTTNDNRFDRDRRDRDHFAFNNGDNGMNRWDRDRDDHFASNQSSNSQSTNNNGMTGDNDRNRHDRHDHFVKNDHDRDNKDWGHWSWDRKNDFDQSQVEMNGSNTSNSSVDMSASSPNSVTTNAAVNDNTSVTGSQTSSATGSSTTPVNTGSSTSVTGSNTASVTAPSPAVTPVSTAPVVTPHVAPPHITTAHK